MFDMKHNEASAQGETTEIFITDSPDGQWAYIDPHGAIFVSIKISAMN